MIWAALASRGACYVMMHGGSPYWRSFARLELRRLGTAFVRGFTPGTLAYALCLWVLCGG